VNDAVTAVQPPAGSDPPVAAAPRPPMWVWPSIALGVVYPALARSARLDADLMERLPDAPTNLQRLPSPYQTILVGFTFAVAVLFSLLRVGGEFTSWLGVGIEVIYSESYIFMLLALAIGLLSPSAGLLLVLFHIPFDIVASLGATQFGYGQLEPLLPALAGRAVSWWLLWLLAVAIPLMARGIPGAVMASGQPRDPQARLLTAYGAAAITVAALVWMWTIALPYLIRPVFTWTSMGSPTDPSVQPIQATGWVLIVASVPLLLAVAAVRQKYGVLEEEAYEVQQPDDLDDLEDEPLVSDQVQFLGNIAAHIFVVLGLGGLISGAFDAALLFFAALLGQLGAGRLARWGPLGAFLVSIPWVARFLVGFGVTYLFGLIISNFMFEPLQTDFISSEFFPLLVTVAVGLALFRLLLGAEAPPPAADAEPGPDDPRPTETPSPGPAAGAAALVLAAAIGAMVLLFASPSVAQANNCSGWYDCNPTMGSIAGAGAGAAAIVALTAALAAARAQEPGRQKARRRRRKRAQEAAPSEAATGTPENVVERLRRRALGNYYRRPPKP
jgi:hypothetical protein